MKFKRGSDFYKALAFFSQAGCPFTQAGSLAPQTEIYRPETASSTVASGSSDHQIGDATRSLPSTAGSDQRSLVPNHVAAIQASSRPSTSSGIAGGFESAPSRYTTLAYDEGKAMPYSKNSHVSPFFTEPNGLSAIPNPVPRQDETPSLATFEASRCKYFPSSSDPYKVAKSGAESSADATSKPTSYFDAPRPWTAPSLESQSLLMMLPPKRELPFKASSTSGTGRKVSKKFQEAPMLLASNLDKLPAGSTSDSSVQINTPANCKQPVPPKKSPAKRATGATRVTRSGTAARRSRNQPSAAPDEFSVPSVEDLLRRSEQESEKQAGIISVSSNDSKVSRNAFAIETGHRILQEEEYRPRYQASNIDTQALLARVEERERVRESKQKDIITESHEDLPIPPLAKRIASGSHDAVKVSQSLATVAEVTAAELHGATLQNDGNSHSAINAVSNIPENTIQHCLLQERTENPPSSERRSELRPTTSIAGEDANHPGAGGPPTTGVLGSSQQVRPHPFAGSSLIALMNDPDFAGSPEFKGWRDLPQEEQHAALETWMCQQLNSERFAELLKMLEGTWQRIFFGR